MTRAELQRRLQVGVRLRLVYRIDGPQKLDREVIRVQSNGVYMRGPDCASSWLGFQKGQAIRATATGFEIHWPSGNVLGYEWVAAPAEQLDFSST